MRFFSVIAVCVFISQIIYAKDIKITNYELYYAKYHENNQTNYIIRAFDKKHQKHYVAVEDRSLKTKVVSAKDIQDIEKSDETFKSSRYYKTLQKYTKYDGTISNHGLIKGESRAEALFLTIDLCPSSKKGFEKDFFKFLIKHNIKHIAVAVSGLWIKSHQKEFLWLLKQQKSGHFSITWVNHTYKHYYNPKLPLSKNFLLAKDTNLDDEVLKLEKILLAYGEIPSVFIRFLGLIADKKVLDNMKEKFLLIPLGSNSWIAKNQKIEQNAIILVHGNLNEPSGIKKMKDYITGNRSLTNKFQSIYKAIPF